MAAAKTQQLKRVLETSSGKHLGDVVWTEIRDVDDQCFSRDDIADKLRAAGLDENMIKDDVSPQGALGRASRAQDSIPGYSVESAKRRQQALLLMKVEGTGKDTVKRTCAQLVIEDDGSLTYLASQHWDAGAQGCFDALLKKYQHYLDYVTHRDVSRMVTRAILVNFQGVRLKTSGHVYWVPERHAEKMRAFAGVIEELGDSELNSLPIYDTAESKAVAARAMRRNFMDEIATIKTRVQALKESDRSTRDSTLDRKLRDIDDIKVRIDACKAILGKQAASLTKAMKQAVAATEELYAKVDAVPGFDDE